MKRPVTLYKKLPPGHNTQHAGSWAKTFVNRKVRLTLYLELSKQRKEKSRKGRKIPRRTVYADEKKERTKKINNTGLITRKDSCLRTEKKKRRGMVDVRLYCRKDKSKENRK